jgi:predicted nucleotidyltransferase
MFQKRNRELEVLKLYLGDYSGRFYLREISSLSGIPVKTAYTVLGNMEKSRILRSQMSGKNRYFFLNLENIETRSALMQAEVERTADFLERYPAFRTFLKEMGTAAMVLVFGSFAGFRAGKGSDVDILVIGKGPDLPGHLLPNRLHEVSLSEEAFLKAWKNDETLIKKVREKHVILNNHSLFVNMMWGKYAG